MLAVAWCKSDDGRSGEAIVVEMKPNYVVSSLSCAARHSASMHSAVNSQPNRQFVDTSSWH
jgi:hypothetical protein